MMMPWHGNTFRIIGPSQQPVVGFFMFYLLLAWASCRQTSRVSGDSHMMSQQWWHWILNKVVFILQTTLLNAYSWKKMLVFWYKFHQILFGSCPNDNLIQWVRVMAWYQIDDNPLPAPLINKQIRYPRYAPLSNNNMFNDDLIQSLG